MFQETCMPSDDDGVFAWACSAHFSSHIFQDPLSSSCSTARWDSQYIWNNGCGSLAAYINHMDMLILVLRITQHILGINSVLIMVFHAPYPPCVGAAWVNLIHVRTFGILSASSPAPCCRRIHSPSLVLHPFQFPMKTYLLKSPLGAPNCGVVV